jgi:hypothetical protein
LNPEELKKIIEDLNKKLSASDSKELNNKLSNLESAYPFNYFEFNLMFLLDKEVITFEYYEELRKKYVEDNNYLELFPLSPRVFGEIWAQQLLMDLDPRFVKPTKKLDPKYDGQYDLLIERFKVEVKASRAINTKIRGDLVSKALRFRDDKPFWMNFQQLKVDIADVFVFIGVWVDQIRYWVLSNEEVKKSRYLSHQHRGGVEYQIGITRENLSEFDKYLVGNNEIGKAILYKTRRS